MTSGARRELIKLLADDLGAIARRGLSRLFLTVRDQGPVDMPYMLDVLAVVRPGEPTAEAIRAVLEAEIDELPLRRGYGTTYQDIAKIIFLTPEDVLREIMHDRGRENYYEAAVELLVSTVHGLASKNAREVVRPMRELLAEQLIKRAFPSLPGDPPEEEEVVELASQYISRARLHAEFDFAMYADLRPVCLWGESGTGKTELARRLQRDDRYRDVELVWLRGGAEGDAFDVDLAQLLLERRATPKALSSFASRVARLREHLKRADANLVYVFDDLAPEVYDLLFTGTADLDAKIVLTQRTEPESAFGTAIHVAGYEQPEESVAAGRLVLPGADPILLQELAATLGNRPIAINIACRLIGTGDYTFSEVLKLADVDMSVTMDDAWNVVDERYSEPIAAVYRKLSAVLRSREDQRALPVLDTILWLMRRDVSQATLTCLATGSLPSELAAQSGFAQLRRLGVVRTDSSVIEINDLTLALLRQAFLDRVTPTLEAFLELGHDVMSVLPKPFGHLEWSRYMELVSRASDDGVFRLRLLHQQQLLRARWMFELFARDFDAGSLFLGYDEYLLWQRGADWFAPASPVREVALATHTRRSDYVIWWSHGGGPQLAHPDLSAQIRGFKFAQRAGERMWRNAIDVPLDPHMNPAEYLLFEPRASDGIEHRWASDLPPDVAANYDIPVWAACGSLLTPPRDRPTAYCSLCFADGEGTDLDVRGAVAWMTNIVDPDSCQWLLGISLANGFLSRSSDPDWDAMVIDQRKRLIERMNVVSIPDFHRKVRVHWYWHLARILTFEAVHGVFLGIYWRSPVERRVKLATVRKQAVSELDANSACLLARNMADSFEALGDIEGEVDALVDARFSATALGPLNEHLSAIRNRLTALGHD